MKRVILDIPDGQAMGLPQLCRRFCWEDAVRFANPHDGGRERDAILDGTLTLQRALREAGLRRADPDLEDSVPTSNRILRGGIGPPGGFHHDQHHESISLPLACQHAGRDRCYGAGRCNWLCRLPAESDDPIFTLIAEHQEAMRAERLFATGTTSRTRQRTLWR
jgi:hypothetical protein